MKKSIKELESIDLEDLYFNVEQHATEVENAFIKKYSE